MCAFAWQVLCPARQGDSHRLCEPYLNRHELKIRETTVKSPAHVPAEIGEVPLYRWGFSLAIRGHGLRGFGARSTRTHVRLPVCVRTVPSYLAQDLISLHCRGSYQGLFQSGHVRNCPYIVPFLRVDIALPFRDEVNFSFPLRRAHRSFSSIRLSVMLPVSARQPYVFFCRKLRSPTRLPVNQRATTRHHRLRQF